MFCVLFVPTPLVGVHFLAGLAVKRGTAKLPNKGPQCNVRAAKSAKTVVTP